ncbi:MAG: radical SAM/SPASM domain-containing protein [Proteobacteria bacterium]|nr:radical SAM/SPASM domain-containing protein [Pseudomonadota bacterium]
MFKNVYLEISNICNLRCSFCPTVKREKKFIFLPDFKKIITQVAPLTEVISLHLMGEPLTHPNFSDILKACEPFGTKIQITTNGIEINKFKDLILNSKAIKQVNFSIQCFKDNFPNKDLDNYLQNILTFAVTANELKPNMYINLRLWNIGADSKENESVFLFVEDFFKIKVKRNIDVAGIKTKRIWNRLSLSFDSRFEWPSLESQYNGTRGTCHGLKGHFGILVDGTVVPCCLDKEGEIPLGNCLTQELNSILKSSRAIKMRDGFDKGVLVEKLCQHCSYIKRFSKD